jgi:hypothetical protein
MERPIKQNFTPLWRLMRLCLIPVGIGAGAVGIVLYTHGQKDLKQLLVNVLGSFVVFLPLLLVVVLGGMRPTVKWFITDSGLKRVIRGSVLMIPWQQIYRMANTDYGFFVRWRDPQEPGVAAEDLEHRARFYPTEADADELIALWQQNISREHQVAGKAYYKARNVRVSNQLRVLYLGMIAGGAVLIGWGALNIARQYPSTSWPSVGGKIISQQYRTIPPGGSHKYWNGEVTLSYEYAVAGHTNHSDQYSLSYERFRDDEDTAKAFAQEHQRGAAVAVYYNPKHPEQAVLLTGPSWRDNCALIIFGGFLAFVSFAVQAGLNIAKRGEKMRKR